MAEYVDNKTEFAQLVIRMTSKDETPLIREQLEQWAKENGFVERVGGYEFRELEDGNFGLYGKWKNPNYVGVDD